MRVFAFLCILSLLAVCAFLGVQSVQSVQVHNDLTAEVHRLKLERDELQSDWSAFLLEYRLLINDKHLERVLGEGVDLEVPESKQLVYLDYDDSLRVN